MSGKGPILMMDMMGISTYPAKKSRATKKGEGVAIDSRGCGLPELTTIEAPMHSSTHSRDHRHKVSQASQVAYSSKKDWKTRILESSSDSDSDISLVSHPHSGSLRSPSPSTSFAGSGSNGSFGQLNNSANEQEPLLNEEEVNSSEEDDNECAWQHDSTGSEDTDSSMPELMMLSPVVVREQRLQNHTECGTVRDLTSPKSPFPQTPIYMNRKVETANMERQSQTSQDVVKLACRGESKENRNEITSGQVEAVVRHIASPSSTRFNRSDPPMPKDSSKNVTSKQLIRDHIWSKDYTLEADAQLIQNLGSDISRPQEQGTRNHLRRIQVTSYEQIGLQAVEETEEELKSLDNEKSKNYKSNSSGRFSKMLRKTMFAFYESEAECANKRGAHEMAKRFAEQALKLLDESEVRGEICPTARMMLFKEQDCEYNIKDYETDDDEEGSMTLNSNAFKARINLQSVRYDTFLDKKEYDLALGIVKEITILLSDNPNLATARYRAFVHSQSAEAKLRMLRKLIIEENDADFEVPTEKLPCRDEVIDDLYTAAESSCLTALSLLGERYNGYYPIPELFPHEIETRKAISKKQDYANCFTRCLDVMIELQALHADSQAHGHEAAQKAEYYRWMKEDFEDKFDRIKEKKVEAYKRVDGTLDPTNRIEGFPGGSKGYFVRERSPTGLELKPTGMCKIQTFHAVSLFLVPAALVVGIGLWLDSILG